MTMPESVIQSRAWRLLAVGRDTLRPGQNPIYHLRTHVFAHVQRQPIAFFTRAQTGSLVSRLNSDRYAKLPLMILLHQADLRLQRSLILKTEGFA
jgi:ABC-type multidrug transport system fused ATPase/permease subunit